jgi:hypothetical protein
MLVFGHNNFFMALLGGILKQLLQRDILNSSKKVFYAPPQEALLKFILVEGKSTKSIAFMDSPLIFAFGP